MAIQDRRSGQERRGINRYQIELEVEWEASKGRSTGTISDLSLDGCFVLSSGDVTDGEPVRVLITLKDGTKAEFTGFVVNHAFEIGFGVKFDKLTTIQRNLLFEVARDFESS